MDKSRIIKYKNHKIVVDLDWREASGPKPSIIRNKIKEINNRHKYDGFGAKIESGKNMVQVGFSNKKSKGIPALAKVLASNEDFSNSLILIKFEEDVFWAVSITEKGMIVTGHDSIYKEDDFVSTISDLLQIDEGDSKIFIPEDCKAEIEELLEEYIEDKEIETIDLGLLLAADQKENVVEQIFNGSIDTLKTLGTFALVGTILVGGYLFVYKDSAEYERIVNQEISDTFNSKYGKYKSDLKKEKKAGGVQGNSVVTAQTEILKNQNTGYSRSEVVSYMKQLTNDFPLYLVEWQLIDVHYINESNEYFQIEYQRIPNSYGYKSQIQKELVSILNEKKYSNYQFDYTTKDSNSFKIKFKFKNKPVLAIQKEASGALELKEKQDKSTKELKKISGSIASSESSVTELGFFDKKFGDGLANLEMEISNKASKGVKLIKSIEKDKKKLKNKTINFDEKLISSNRSEMLSMMQKYSYYAWGEKSNPVNYPTTVQKGKKSQSVKYYAKSYEFEVGVGNNINLIGLDGLKDILLSDRLLNKPFIKIMEVSFNLEQEKWSIKGESYEKI